MNSLLESVSQRVASLSSRERRVLGIGMVAVGLLLGYQAVWVPVDGWASSQERRLESRIDLATHVAESRQRLSRLPAVSEAASTETRPEAPLREAMRLAQQHGLGDRVRAREKLGETGVRLRFEGAPLPAVMRWLVAMSNSGFSVRQATLGRDERSGIVRMDIELLR